MNILCWLIDHAWARDGGHIKCRRCGSEPYDDTTLPEWFYTAGIVRRAKQRAKRVVTWFRSRPCWFVDHDWHPAKQICQRCKQTGIEVAEQGEWTWPVWKQLLPDWWRDNFYVVKPYMKEQAIYAVQARNWRWGLERSTIYIRGEKYMTRYIAYVGPFGLRLHHFFRGDDDRASHTHPWWFVTFPFSDYYERLFKKGKETGGQIVRRFRFHYREATHEHIVVGRALAHLTAGWLIDAHSRSFWTFVITGPRSNDWGFYPSPGKFVYWRDYNAAI